jgi:molybdate transport system substrate-binding protein
LKEFYMKRLSAILLALILAPGMWAAPKTEIIVAAAASLTDTLNELITLYQKEKPDVKVTPTYGASGSLQKQIEQGAPVDLFISAAAKQMDALQKANLVVADTRKNLLENQVVLVVPASKTGIASFADAGTDKVRQIALGEAASVPAGQYAEQIFTSLTILDAVRAKAVYAKDVRQVLAYVEAGEVDAGVVYATDALTSKGVKVAAVAPAGSHSPVVYPAAVVSASANAGTARDFLQWLSGTGAKAVFAKYGFTTK